MRSVLHRGVGMDLRRKSRTPWTHVIHQKVPHALTLTKLNLRSDAKYPWQLWGSSTGTTLRTNHFPNSILPLDKVKRSENIVCSHVVYLQVERIPDSSHEMIRKFHSSPCHRRSKLRSLEHQNILKQQQENQSPRRVLKLTEIVRQTYFPVIFLSCCAKWWLWCQH